MAKQTFTTPDIDLSRFAYNPETGIVTRTTGKKAGLPVGTLNHHGYLQTTIEKQFVAVHRLAWRLHTGEWPMERIDHENGKGSDNRWENIRLASSSQNGMNRDKQSNNTSGYKGVQFAADQPYQPWKAVIVVEGQLRVVGSYRTKEQAAWAYDREATRIFGEFARINGIPFPGRPKRAKGGLGLEGVAIQQRKDRTVYRALGTIGTRREHLGFYTTASDAATAYDIWLERHPQRGKKRLNYPLFALGRLCMDDRYVPARA